MRRTSDLLIACSKVKGVRHVVVKVAQWLSHRFAHGLETRKVDDTVNSVFGKNAIEC